MTSKKKKKSPWLVFIAIFLAFIVGNLTGTDAQIFGVTFYSLFDLFGTLFIHALTLVVVPLVSSSIITGIARIGGDSSFGRLGLKVFSFYILTTLSAVIVGLIFVNLIGPGYAESLQSSVQSRNASFSSIEQHLVSQDNVSFFNLVLSIIPSNILEAFAKGEMLALIFFSLLFGYAISKIATEPSNVLQNFFQGVFQSMIHITHMIMKFLPFGVFCLVAKVAATTGFESLASLAWFFLTVILGLLFFSGVILPLLLKFIGKVNPKNHVRAMAPALITAFSTSSSSATLPITIDCVEKRAGVSNRICSLVIPLGTSLNMSGSALYECVAAMFVAQVYGIEISVFSQVIFVLLALLTSMGVAGIPAASLVAVIVILKAFGLPIEGIGLFLAVDRILDMCRTTVNVFSDSCCAILVARSEGEKNILTKTVFTEE
jgi:proton glutamate symport protein